ncbi:hypothetical protein HPB47_013651 [Ixodes persulcatus]|uniref:Uncharacterized protein n=1 Tax=Ixodes persulcatus TaxID=34615 RepID=A0AC60R0R1_IXOPE|nr:hypothetical protein HPB47_013651 [Ixodes persulcatus]
MDIRARDVPLSGAVVKQKAKDFGCLLYRDDFKASSGCLHRFKARHEIVGKMDLKLTNVELQFLPPNCTSLIQPLDQGIINSVKWSYRWRLIDKLLLDLCLKRQTKVDIFQDL